MAEPFRGKGNFELIALTTNNRRMSIASAQRNLKLFDANLMDVPRRTREKINQGIYKRVYYTVKDMWRSNYLAHKGWAVSNNTRGGAIVKGLMTKRGDTFRLKPLGLRGMSKDSSVFGIRTGNLLDSFTSRSQARATDLEIKHTLTKTGLQSGIDIGLFIRVKTGVFRSKQNVRFIGGDRSKSRKVSQGNYFQSFSKMITPGNSRGSSVLVQLLPKQADDIRRMIKGEYHIAARTIIIAEAIKKLSRAA